jgi:hypothetical protein
LSDYRKRQHFLAFLLTAALMLCAAGAEAHNGAVALRSRRIPAAFA